MLNLPIAIFVGSLFAVFRSGFETLHKWVCNLNTFMRILDTWKQTYFRPCLKSEFYMETEQLVIVWDPHGLGVHLKSVWIPNSRASGFQTLTVVYNRPYCILYCVLNFRLKERQVIWTKLELLSKKKLTQTMKTTISLNQVNADKQVLLTSHFLLALNLLKSRPT